MKNIAGWIILLVAAVVGVVLYRRSAAAQHPALANAAAEVKVDPAGTAAQPSNTKLDRILGNAASILADGRAIVSTFQQGARKPTYADLTSSAITTRPRA